MAVRSSVVFAEELPADPAQFSVLVNLGVGVPDGFDTFKRVIEVVSLEDEDRQQARVRWKQYTSLGYDIERHDLKLKASN
jgi:DNA polymerase-3 subunit chi